jgi:hypothetical protein
VAGSVLILATPSAWINRKILSNPLAVWIGLISYPLYLWHWPLIVLANFIDGGEPSTLLLLGYLAVAIFLSYLTYQFLEKPIRSNILNSKTIYILIFLMTLVTFLGGITYLKNGFPFRSNGNMNVYLQKPNFTNQFYGRKQNCNLFSPSKYLSICEEEEKPIIFLLGDSHASSLIAGLNSLQRTHIFGLDSAVGCGDAPYLSNKPYGDEGSCDSSVIRHQFNSFALTKITAIKPDIVILHARWAYKAYEPDKSSAMLLLRETIHEINLASPNTKVMVLGPVPNWKISPTRAIITSLRTQIDKAIIPIRLRTGLVAEIKSWDDRMEKDVPSMGATYFSAYKVFCNDDGCLTRLGDSASDVTAVDEAHLSPIGSKFLASNIQPMLFSLFDRPPENRK